jgi:hypothetical protein
MAELWLDSFPPPRKESWWRKVFVLRPGDVWEQRVNEWGVWDEDALSRWVWDGKKWDELDTD